MARRSYSSRSAPRRRSSTRRRSSVSRVRRTRSTGRARRVSSRSVGSRAQTLRIVIEQPNQSSIGREMIGLNATPAQAPKKARI